jgi:hypothetical protein
MSLKQKHIEQFRTIFEKEYGRVLADEDAWEMASNVLDYARLLLEIAEEQTNHEETELPRPADQCHDNRNYHHQPVWKT